MESEGEGGGISRRQKSTKGVIEKFLPITCQWGDHKNITVPYGEIK